MAAVLLVQADREMTTNDPFVYLHHCANFATILYLTN
jgi:hypothetical protein